MFQVYSSVIHHLYIILCIHHPKLSLPSLFIPPLTSSSSLYPPSLWYHHTIVFVNEGLLTWIPAHGIRVLWQQWTNSNGLQKSCGEKGMAWPLSKWERGREGQREPKRAWPLPGQAFIAFLGILHRMVLIYYAQVHHRWLPFTDNKGKNAANYFKEKDVAAQGGKWLNWLHSILGRFSTDLGS